MATFGVVLDANVLVPASLRDALLTIAEHEFFRPHWSNDILREVKSVLERKGMTSALQADSIIERMNVAFEDAMVTDYESLIPALTNDIGDRHVLAAAIQANAQTIVTNNLKDFPPYCCQIYNIEAQHPDTFLVHQYHLEPDGVIQSLQVQASRLNDPPMDLHGILATLELHAPEFCDLVRSHQHIH